MRPGPDRRDGGSIGFLVVLVLAAIVWVAQKLHAGAYVEVGATVVGLVLVIAIVAKLTTLFREVMRA